LSLDMILLIGTGPIHSSLLKAKFRKLTVVTWFGGTALTVVEPRLAVAAKGVVQSYANDPPARKFLRAAVCRGAAAWRGPGTQGELLESLGDFGRPKQRQHVAEVVGVENIGGRDSASGVAFSAIDMPTRSNSGTSEPESPTATTWLIE
jgi:hypothetical protein